VDEARADEDDEVAECDNTKLELLTDAKHGLTTSSCAFFFDSVHLFSFNFCVLIGGVLRE
jgi:hypothetical protein